MSKLRADAEAIIFKTFAAINPEKSVIKALSERRFGKRVYLAAIGKAAYTMARAAKEALGEKITRGVVVTKYGHASGRLEGIRIIEAGHPIPDDNSLKGAEAILEMTTNLSPEDEVLFLVSGGGSALFELPEEGLTLCDLDSVNRALLLCGADITEINAVRKRLSAVKAGKFAKHCEPAKVFSVILSDVLGDRLDMVASGPTFPDGSTSGDALSVIKKYKLHFAEHIMDKLYAETPKTINNAEATLIGNIGILCGETAKAAESLGYEPLILCRSLNCEAREAGRFLAAIAWEARTQNRPRAIIAGGETVVTVRGKGMGGRNQELALAAADNIDGLEGAVIFSVSSDGTDGPTDAAGGIVDGGSKHALLSLGVNIPQVLANNDSYHALKQIGGLIITGPTGCNVNDVSVILID